MAALSPRSTTLVLQGAGCYDHLGALNILHREASDEKLLCTGYILPVTCYTPAES